MKFTTTFAMLLSALAYAQTPPETHENLEIVYRDLRVHVLDADHQPVKGLTAADFVLKAAGEKLPISYFEEVSYAPVRSSHQNTADSEQATLPRAMVLVLDSSMMRKRHFDWAREALLNFAERNLGHHTAFKLIHLDGVNINVFPLSRRFETFRDQVEGLERHAELFQASYYSERELNRARFLEESMKGDLLEWAQGMDPQHKYMLQQNARGKLFYYKHFWSVIVQTAEKMASIPAEKSMILLSAGQFGPPGYNNLLGQKILSHGVTLYSMLYDSPRPIPFQQVNVRETHRTMVKTLAEPTRDSGGLFLKAAMKGGAEAKMEQLEQSVNHYYRVAFSMPKNQLGKTKLALAQKRPGVKLHHGNIETQTQADLANSQDALLDQRAMNNPENWPPKTQQESKLLTPGTAPEAKPVNIGKN